MLKVIFGFLPWILYFSLLGATAHQHEIAILSAIAANLLFDFRELAKGFILSWGTLIFFLVLLILEMVIPNSWIELHGNLIANIGLGAIVWLSILIKKPFTIQYAKEQVAKEFWETPAFYKINLIISIFWGISFLLSVAINLLRLYSIIHNNLVYQILSYAPSLVAIILTKQFPDWYRNRYANRMIEQSALKQKNNRFLSGNFAPVHDELSVENLSVEGELPQDLLGIYMRNGANPEFKPFSYDYPFDGDGMLHAIYFKDGKAGYRNRFIVTDQLQVERRLGKAVYGGVSCPFIRDQNRLNPEDPKIPVKLGRFIHVIRHAGIYLALHEGTSAYEVTAGLDTKGEWNPTHETPAISVNAHTRLDPATGELYLISYDTQKPIINYHVLDHKATFIKSGIIELPRSHMVHDFVLTKNYFLIVLCPVIVDFTGMLSGKPFFNWQPNLGTRIALVSRQSPSQKIIWIDTETFFSYHYANAYETETEIVIDHVRYESFSMDTASLNAGHLYRTTIRLSDKQCVHTKMDDTNIEFPRINDLKNSNPYRYVYTPSNLQNKNSGECFRALIKYDLTKGNSAIHDFGETCEIGEAVFVPKPKANAEDDGYVMVYVYHRILMQSELIVLDAQNIAAKPLAKVHLPRRVPHGLHGSWFPGAHDA